MLIIPLLLICLSVITSVDAQEQTVGVFIFDSTRATDGYTLFMPSRSTTIFLIDNSGRLINAWSDSYMPGLNAYLLENGDLLRTCKVVNQNFWAGGKGGIIKEIDWYGNFV